MALIRVLSYNIHKGFAGLGSDFVLAQIKESIRSVGADIVFLQEVLGEHERHGKKLGLGASGAQFEFLADEVWPHFAYGKNAVYSEGHHGNAILSKFPIKFSENIDISLSRWERRGILHAQAEIPDSGTKLDLLCLHLNLLERHRREQIQLVLERVRTALPQGPAIIAGDFNDWREQASRELEAAGFTEAHAALHGHHASTYPSFWPILGLDRIYARDLVPQTAQTLNQDYWQKLSDHIPIVVEFSL